MKNNKELVVNETQAEILKYAGVEATFRLFSLLRLCTKMKNIGDYKKSIIVILLKK